MWSSVSVSGKLSRENEMLKFRNYFKRKQYEGPVSGTNVLKETGGVSTSDIIITVAAVIVIIVSTIFMISNITKLRNINKEIDELNVTIAAKQEALNKLIELGNSEELLTEKYERNKLYIPEYKDEVGINSDITSIIMESDGTFRKLTFGEEKTLENGITDMLFVVRVECSYENLDEIIDKIEKTDRLYIISSILIVDTSASTGTLSSDITIHAYYRQN